VIAGSRFEEGREGIQPPSQRVDGLPVIGVVNPVAVDFDQKLHAMRRRLPAAAGTTNHQPEKNLGRSSNDPNSPPSRLLASFLLSSQFLAVPYFGWYGPYSSP
jgi:hypothetical protein